MLRRKYLDIEPEGIRYLEGMKVWLKIKLPPILKYLERSSSHPSIEEVSAGRPSVSAETRNLAKQIQASLKGGVHIIDSLLGGRPDQNTISESTIFFTRFRKRVLSLFQEVQTNGSLMESLSEEYGDMKTWVKQISSATSIIESYMQAFHERGLRWTKEPSAIRGGMEGMIQGVKSPIRGESIAGQAIVGLFGPLAPVAQAVVGGLGGLAGGISRTLQNRRMMRQVRKISPGIAAEAMGMGSRDLGGYDVRAEGGATGLSAARGVGGLQAGDLLGFMRGRERYRDVGAQNVDTQSKAYNKKILVPALAAGMAEFYDKAAFKARYTRALLKAVRGGETRPELRDEKEGFDLSSIFTKFLALIPTIIPIVLAALTGAGIAKLLQSWTISAKEKAKMKPSDVQEQHIAGIVTRAAKRGQKITREEAEQVVTQVWREKAGWSPVAGDPGTITADNRNLFQKWWDRAATPIRRAWYNRPWFSEKRRVLEGEQSLVEKVIEQRETQPAPSAPSVSPSVIREATEVEATKAAAGSTGLSEQIKNEIQTQTEEIKKLGKQKDPQIISTISSGNADPLQDGLGMGAGLGVE